jgi:dTDP-4-amino-4,6-dideoxygalactose transaminase
MTNQEGFLPFALPDIGQEEIDEVVDSLRSGWITTGPKTKRFEEAFAEFLGGNVYAIAVNSATAGLHLAVEALGIGPGDEVITTVHTFTATAEVIRYTGADPVFVDVDPDTYCIDPEKVRNAITANTKAIIPVHYAGLAASMDKILQLAEDYGLAIIEDAAHALPSTHNGRLIGSLASDVTVFSFYATKPLATGEGGMVVTRNSDIAKRCRVMRLHGIDRDAFDRYTSTRPSWYYEVVAPGFKYNMTDLAAALGIQQLKKTLRFQRIREGIAERYLKALSDLPLQMPPLSCSGDMHSWHLFPIQLDDAATVSRDLFIARMAEEGIGCSVHYRPLHLHPYWRDTYSLKPEQFPCATRICERLVSLPIYTKMTERDQDRAIGAIRRILS